MTSYYNEIDPFAAAWLRELINAGHIAPGDVDTRSIVDVRPDDLKGYAQCHFFAGIGVWSYALRRAGWADNRPVWTGSCPCQPFSAAGKGEGVDDARHLWPDWFWLISQCRPAVIFGEQVASKAAELWIDLVSFDMEALGYAVGAVPFPSAGVGAPHIRDRTYWLADANVGAGREGRADLRGRPDRGDAQPRAGLGRSSDANGLADDDDARLEGRWQPECERAAERPVGPGVLAGGVADADGGHAGAERQQSSGQQRQQQQEDGRTGGMADAHNAERRPVTARGHFSNVDPGPTNGVWRDADWLFCRDGKWRPVEPGTFPLVARTSEGVVRGGDTSAAIDAQRSSEGRVGRLRGYGNAINAAAAEAFIGAYLDGR